MGLTSLAVRTLTARPLRSLLTIVGVALGVGVLSASLTLGAGLESAINRTVRGLVGNADLRISSFLERGLSDATVEAIRTMEGVAVASPIVERQTFLRATPGKNSGTVTVVGVDPETYSAVHPLDLVGGSLLARLGERSAVISEQLAASEGYGLGSELTILGFGNPTHLRVVGIVAERVRSPRPAAGRSSCRSMSPRRRSRSRT